MLSRRVGDPLKATCLALILGTFLIRVALVRRHAFDPDEFQHLHGAWSIANGLLPYRDYFEHHTPWLHFFLAAFVGFFEVETSARAAEAFVFFARGWMCVFSALALALTFRLGRVLGGDATAWVATAILGLTVMFLDKTLEIRPDVPGVAFLLGSWLALLSALGGGLSAHRTRVAFATSGWLLGTALLCTQKVLFTLPATFVPSTRQRAAGGILRRQDAGISSSMPRPSPLPSQSSLPYSRPGTARRPSSSRTCWSTCAGKRMSGQVPSCFDCGPRTRRRLRSGSRAGPEPAPV